MAGKRKHECECEECPEWIFTFADLVMLMMGFFVILWVLKPAAGANAPEDTPAREEWIQTVAAIREAFGYVPDFGSTDPIDRILLDRMNSRSWRGPGAGGRTNEPRIGAVGTDETTTAIRIARQSTIGAKVEFDAGEASISGSSVKVLDQIADIIRGHRNLILVKGHVALDEAAGPDVEGEAMELSVRRAKVVRDQLIWRGVSADTLRIMGCGTHEPVKRNAYTPQTQAPNRRVEIESTSTLVGDMQGGP